MRGIRPAVVVAAVTVLLRALLASGSPARAISPVPSVLQASRPNILILVSDDQKMATFTRTFMPSVFSQLVDEGVRFDRFYVNSSVCCPSRSEILTGLNEQHTGVDDNGVQMYRPTIVEALHELGYRTMLSGKYLNSMPCDPRAEFDQWVCQSHSPPSGLSLVDPTLNVNGTWTTFNGYTTEIEADFAIDFIASTPTDRPFFVLYTPTSPHLPANDDRYRSMPVPPNHPPSFDEETRTSGKPYYMQRGPMPADEIARHDQRFAKMTRAVRGLDDSMGRILASLGDRGRETLVFFLSDNGFLLGEHRRVAKMVPYEESTHVPFVVRYPSAVPESGPFRSDALVSNIDIAPTIADVVGIHWGADGASLIPLLTGQASSIHEALLVNWCEGVHTCAGNKLSHAFIEPQLSIPSYFGAVTLRYKYVEYRSGEKELYDLQQDPYELVNHAGDLAWSTVQSQMAATLSQLKALPPVDTTIVTGPRGAVRARAFALRYFSQSRFATYQCRLDRDGVLGTWGACGKETELVGPLEDGDYVFGVRGTDERGFTDPAPASRSFSIDTIGPDVHIDSAPAAHLKNRSVSFGFSSQTPGVSFRCRLGPWGGTAGPWSSCATGVTYGPLADDLWAFEVRAVDGTGAATDPPALWLFQIDNAGPTMIFDSKPAKTATSTTAYFRFHPDEPTTGPFTCRLDGGTAADCSGGTYRVTGLARTTHTLAVYATDTLGNGKTTTYTWKIT